MANKTNTLTEQLNESVRKCIEGHEGEIEISPAYVASCAFQQLDPERTSPNIVKWGCILELRSISRSILRETFDPIDGEHPKQHVLFPGLQDRYPTKRIGGPKYVKLEHLTNDECRYNINRLRKEANKKLDHADALEEFADLKFDEPVVAQ